MRRAQTRGWKEQRGLLRGRRGPAHPWVPPRPARSPGRGEGAGHLGAAGAVAAAPHAFVELLLGADDAVAAGGDAAAPDANAAALRRARRPVRDLRHGAARRRHGAAPRGGRDRRGGNSPAAAARGKRPGCGTGTSVCSGPPRPRRRTEAPNRPPPAAPPKRRGGCRLRIAPPGTRRGLGGRTGRVRDRGRPGAPRCAPPLGATHRCGRGNPAPCRSGSGVAPRGRSGRR